MAPHQKDHVDTLTERLDSAVSTRAGSSAALIAGNRRHAGDSAGALATPSQHSPLDALYRKITLHLMTPFMIVVVLNHLDRNNLAYAALTMNTCA
jgi:hypothetical protein